MCRRVAAEKDSGALFILMSVCPAASKQGGIGIVIQPNAEGAMLVVRLVPGGPADKSGKVTS